MGRRVRHWKSKIENRKTISLEMGLIIMTVAVLLFQNGGGRLLTIAFFRLQTPVVTYGLAEKQESLFTVLEECFVNQIPLYRYCMEKQQGQTSMESVLAYELRMEGEPEKTKPEKEDRPVSAPVKSKGDFRKDILKRFSEKNLKNHDYLIKHFYHVDISTSLSAKRLPFRKLFYKKLAITPSKEKPRILLYHTHAHEEYRNTKKYRNKTVVDVGDALAKLLEEKYHIKVLHHKGVYDDNRNVAYSKALPAVEKVLKEHPSIEVVIDLHRDGIGANTRLVTEIDGKKMAKIMFFNGISYSKVLGPIDYLYNPNLSENLALSMQLGLAADTYYPGLSRGIYIKSYRYNMHLKGRNMLVEVGAQTNTYEEARNAMEPLADLLNRVLNSESEK